MEAVIAKPKSKTQNSILRSKSNITKRNAKFQSLCCPLVMTRFHSTNRYSLSLRQMKIPNQLKAQMSSRKSVTSQLASTSSQTGLSFSSASMRRIFHEATSFLRFRQEVPPSIHKPSLNLIKRSLRTRQLSNKGQSSLKSLSLK